MLGGIVGAIVSAVVGFFVTLPIVGYLFGFTGFFLTPVTLLLSALASIMWAFAGAMFFANLTGKILDRD